MAKTPRALLSGYRQLSKKPQAFTNKYFTELLHSYIYTHQGIQAFVPGQAT